MFRRSLGIAWLSVCALAGSRSAEAGFGYRKAMTIDRTQVGTTVSTLSNFPMLVDYTHNDLRTTANSGHVNNANGYDIIFRALDTTTCGGASVCSLSHESVSYTATTGQVRAWVRLPSVNAAGNSSNSVIYIYYGNSAVSSSSQRITDVWDSSFKAVWHLEEDPNSGGQGLDSTSNANNCTSAGSMVSGDRVAGQINQGWDFEDGAAEDDRATCGSNSALDNIRTLTGSAWINLTAFSNAVNGGINFIVDKRHTSLTGWNLQIEDCCSDNKIFGLLYEWNNGSAVDAFWKTPNGSISTGAWTHVAATYDASSTSNLPLLYINGASQTVTVRTASAGSVTDDSAQDLWLGNRSNLIRNFDGAIDELRISNTIRSADWIKTEYNNTSSPTTFYTGVSAETSNPSSAIRLRDLGARWRRDGIEIAWSTGYEVDNLGFYLHRETDGRRVRLTPDLIAGSALLSGAGTTMASGNSYAWLDASPPRGTPPRGTTVRYWLEEVDLFGKSTFHGPVSPTISPPDETAIVPSALLYEVGSNEREFQVRERRAPPPQVGGVHALERGSRRIRLKVRREGWYRVSFAEVRAAGLAGDPRSLRLLADGEEQAILVGSDGIEFYGLGVDTHWSNARTFFLSSPDPLEVVGTVPKRVPRVEATINALPASPAPSFARVLERRDRSIYFAALKNGEAENFFGPVVAGKPVELAVTVADMASAPAAAVEVELQGVSARAHAVNVSLNGTILGQVAFEAQGRGTWRADVPPGLLVPGENKITLVAVEATDVSLVDVVRLRYQRLYQAEENLLHFPLPKGRAVTVRGFTSPDVRAMDVTDPAASVELEGVISEERGTYNLTLMSERGATDVLAFTGAEVGGPQSVEGKLPLLTPRRADLVIVSPDAFIPALAPLVEKRRSQGLLVDVVDVDAIYDAFSFGQKTPFAVRAFLEQTSKQSGTRFALLVGDASLDPRNHLARGVADFVPTKLVETRLLETASDDWLADFDGDGVSDLALGRLPVRTAEEAATVVDKIVAYAPRRSSSVLVVSGSSGDTDFKRIGEEIVSRLAPGTKGRHVSVEALGAAWARSDLLAALKDPAGHIIEYLGHGSTELWAEGLLQRADVKALGAGASGPSVFVPLTCLNGFFHDVYTESLAEALLRTPQGGAVAVWASSGMTYPEDQFVFGEDFIQMLLGQPVTLGEAAARAKAKVADEDVRRTWILFGDPSMRVNDLPSVSPPATRAPPVPAAPAAAPESSPAADEAFEAIAAGHADGCSCRFARPARSLPALSLLFVVLALAVRVARRTCSKD